MKDNEIKPEEFMAGSDAMELEQNSMGTININDNVTLAIVKKAVLSVPGVTSLASGSWLDDIKGAVQDVVRNKQHSGNSSISISECNDCYVIEVNINIVFGIPIPDVACSVQESVIEAVEHTTGKNVKSVHVFIQDIEEEKKQLSVNSGE